MTLCIYSAVRTVAADTAAAAADAVAATPSYCCGRRRPGDRVVATSATLGDGLWEKNTVDGILSAVGTRLVFSETVTLRVERPLKPQQLAAAR